jgi:hypothetical protein
VEKPKADGDRLVVRLFNLIRVRAPKASPGLIRLACVTPSVLGPGKHGSLESFPSFIQQYSRASTELMGKK